MSEWNTFVRDLKTEIWGPPVIELDPLFHDKFEKVEDPFESCGYRIEVRQDWSFSKFIAMQVEGIPKTCTPVTEQRERVAERCKASMIRGGVCKRRLGHRGKCQTSVYVPRSLAAA